ncbi:membrane protein insertion efficiency factor YidD [Chitinophagales bacterium]|nr:membrane protein insertion efficiency factor YidD [Chitinophagales bacterium]
MSSNCVAQEGSSLPAGELFLLTGLMDQEQMTPYWSKQTETNSTNDIQWVFSQFFQGYKSFISSQDGQSCGFHPSCSVYSLQAVQDYGPLKGLLMGFDRICRCHGMAPSQYTFHSSGLLFDPIP